MHEVRKTVTVLFADVVASTELGERLDPEALRRIVSRYFAEMAEVLERHGGTVEKFIGDEVMAVFGVPAVHEDDALRAVRAAAAMRERLAALNDELERDWGARLQIRIGINTGEVVAGDPAPGHGFVTGDAVNLAKRIETAAEPGEILLGDGTYRLVRHAVETTHVGPLSLKGKREHVEPQRLEEVDAASGAFARRLDAPLVGRAEELAQLRAVYARAVRERRPQLVTVLGPAGIGKSRLVRELLDGAASEAVVLVGRCRPYGEGITFWPVREILPGESFEGTSEEIFWRIRRRLEEHARDGPLVLCFEDVHWGEPTFLDLVQYLAGWMQDVAVLVLCLARPDLLERRPDWPSTGPDALTIRLGPLTDAEAGDLLGLLGAPDATRSRIAQAAEGNPLFVEQMTAMAADAGADVVVPPSIRALLAARLDRLGPDETAVIERAAVVGRDFRLRAVVELVPEELRPRTAGLLLGLVRKELVRPLRVGDDDGFRFRHALIRDAAYEAMPKGLRAELHERHARGLEDAGAEDALVGYHLEQAVELLLELGHRDGRTEGLAARGGELLGRAGRRAFRRDDVPAAVNLLERASALLAGSGSRPAELLTELGTALGTAGRLAEAEDVLESALEAATRSGDRRSELRATILREQTRSFTGRAGPDDLARVAGAVIPELERIGDDLGLARAWRLSSSADVVACRWAARAEALERALAHARRVPEAPQERSSIVAVLVQALYYGPVPAGTALARFEELLDEGAGDPGIRAGVLGHLGGLRALGGDLEEGRRLYGESVALLEELGLRFRRSVVALVGAELAALAGDRAEAERELRTGIQTLGRIGAVGAQAAVSAMYADFLCGDGRDDEAVEAAEHAAGIAAAEDLLPHVVRDAVVGRVAARRGDVPAGRRLVASALERALRTDFPMLQASVLLAEAETAELAGDAAAAREATAGAQARYAAKGYRLAAARLAAHFAP